VVACYNGSRYKKSLKTFKSVKSSSITRSVVRCHVVAENSMEIIKGALLLVSLRSANLFAFI